MSLAAPRHVGVGSTVETAEITADSITSALIADDQIDSEHYVDGSIDTAHIGDNQVTLAKMASGTANKYIGFDGSGDPAEKVGPNWILVETITLGAAATEIDFTGLDLDTDGYYVICFNIDNIDTSAASIRIHLNGDATATNYYSQYLQVNHATITGERANNHNIMSLAASQCSVGRIAVFRDNNTYGIAQASNINRDVGSNLRFFKYLVSTASTIANVTSITLEHETATKIGAGSTASIYKLTTS